MRDWLRDTLAPLLKIEWRQLDFRCALRCLPAVAATLIGGVFAVGVHVHFQLRQGRWIVLAPLGEASGP
ncbi:MAG TPA: hypothetical protein VN980_06985 [Alphaproteobacteria bacterium]|nr:hypothetical protein [Alphaproteobacteria bacterium]